MTLSTLPATVAQRERSASKPNPSRMIAIRYSLAGLPCFLCHLPVEWSRQVDPRKIPHAAQVGHVKPRVSFEKGGGYFPGNLGANHLACNKPAGDEDLTQYLEIGPDGFPLYIPRLWTPTRVALNFPDVREVEPTVKAYTWEDLRKARARRGLPF